MTRGLWTRETVALLLLAAYLPLMLFWLWFGGAGALAQLGLALLVVAVWHLVFMLVRAQPPSLAAITTALAIAMLAPEGLGAFRMVLGISFGVVMGELVFGGWGRNVVHPATVTLSLDEAMIRQTLHSNGGATLLIESRLHEREDFFMLLERE